MPIPRYTTDDIKQMRLDAIAAHLTGPWFFFFGKPEELISVCNGCGSDDMPKWAVDVLTFLFEDYAPSVAIHDCRYFNSDGSDDNRKDADEEFRDNCLRQWRKKWGSLRWLRKSAWHDYGKIRLAYRAVRLFGCKAWQNAAPDNVKPNERKYIMSKKVLLSLSGLCLLALPACFSPTQNTVTEYDADGKMIRQTVTSESVVKTLTESTKDKSVIAWDNSWLAYLSVTTCTAEDPTPTMKMGVGRADKGAATIHKDHDLKLLPEIIESTRAGEISISSSGIGATSTGKTTETNP